MSLFFDDRDALRFCFGPIIQKELDELAVSWNNHRIRHSSMAEVPHGIPDMLYFMPHLSGKFHGYVAIIRLLMWKSDTLAVHLVILYRWRPDEM